jgi:hypothetical protein
MRWHRWCAVVGLAAIPGGSIAGPARDSGRCETFGTAVAFVASPRDAAARAKADGKLVFVLHVAGHFGTPEFT